jgi:broad specificity phosphatase PhoE
MARHGEVYNPKAIFYGRKAGYHLSKEGFRQAAQTAEFIANVPLVAAYSSPLQRARQTAQTILKPQPQLKLQVSPLLLEVRSYQDGWLQSETNNYNFYEPPVHPDSETLVEVVGRVMRFIKQAVTAHPGQHVLAVSHGDPVAITHCYLVGMPVRLASMRQPNLYPQHACVFRYDFPPEGFTEDITRIRVSYYHPPFEAAD